MLEPGKVLKAELESGIHKITSKYANLKDANLEIMFEENEHKLFHFWA
jgi:hypothetical protein